MASAAVLLSNEQQSNEKSSGKSSTSSHATPSSPLAAADQLPAAAMDAGDEVDAAALDAWLATVLSRSRSALLSATAGAVAAIAPSVPDAAAPPAPAADKANPLCDGEVSALRRLYHLSQGILHDHPSVQALLTDSALPDWLQEVLTVTDDESLVTDAMMHRTLLTVAQMRDRCRETPSNEGQDPRQFLASLFADSTLRCRTEVDRLRQAFEARRAFDNENANASYLNGGADYSFSHNNYGNNSSNIFNNNNNGISISISNGSNYMNNSNGNGNAGTTALAGYGGGGGGGF
eukprot:m.71062 g.71062  ORF g.71062 m.71062 type:complete len:291 (-) comp14341_c0_seq1:72-944(-)